MMELLKRTGRVLKTLLLSAFVLVAGGSAAWLANTPAAPSSASPFPAAETPKAEKIARVAADRMTIPESVAAKLGLKTAAVERSTRPLAMPAFQGTLALDNSTFQRPRARFPGEVVELGTVTVPGEASGSTQTAKAVTRPVRDGDIVTKGQLLAVVWCSTLGEKKSELVDALSNLKTDELQLQRLKEFYQQGGSEKSVRDAEQKVKSDQVIVDRAERTLKSWRLTEEEIATVRAEADKPSDPKAKRAGAAEWARVEVRATQAGTVLTKNVNVGDIVDTATDLFQIGDMTRLTVWAHVYESDLPHLLDLPRPIRWSVSLLSRPGVSFPGTLERVGDVIDPNQHTALVSGRVDNPNRELKVGQGVSVTVERPAHPGELVVPTDAVAEDGRESLVFVRTAGDKGEYVRRPVKVVRRTRDHIFLADDPAGVRPGDAVVTAGSLLLRDAMDALPVPPADTSMAAR